MRLVFQRAIVRLVPQCPHWVISRHNGPVRVMSALPPHSGHSSVQVGCPKSAISGHTYTSAPRPLMPQ